MKILNFRYHCSGEETSGEKNPLVLFLFFCLLPFIVSCAPTYQKPVIDMVWPLPPDEPRIRYVDTIRSSLDVAAKTDWTDTLFGEERIDKLSKPYGVAVDLNGRIYIADPGRVFVFDLKNRSLSFIGDTAGLGKLSFPAGIAAARDGRIFITDLSQDRVFVYQNGKYVAAIGETGELSGPSGVALDEKNGLVYVADTKKHVVNIYSGSNYAKVGSIGTRGTDNGQFNYPTNIAVDTDGNLYVVDTGNFRVQIFDRMGNYIRSIGKLCDGPGCFARPKGIALDSDGNLYVIDAAFQNFQIFDKEGKLLMALGGPGEPPGKFWLPAGMTIDHEDRIYVIDQYPGLVQIFQYLSKKPGKVQEKREAEGK